MAGQRAEHDETQSERCDTIPRYWDALDETFKQVGKRVDGVAPRAMTKTDARQRHAENSGLRRRLTHGARSDAIHQRDFFHSL